MEEALGMRWVEPGDVGISNERRQLSSHSAKPIDRVEWPARPP
jgi:hypothetical protein